MKAISVNQPGGAEQLEVVEASMPEPGPGEWLINVKAAGINRTDIISREGKSGYMDDKILGIEVAGIVEKAGSGAEEDVGKRVMGLVNSGGYAEYALMPSDRGMIIPDGVSFTEAAAIPEVFLTAYQTLFWLGGLEENETVLVHAGGSGVGTAAIQLAKKLRHATVITTAGSSEKLQYCRSLGADVLINYREEDFDDRVMHETQNAGVDLILDFIGASYWEKNIRSIRVDGRWILIGTLGGAALADVNLMDLMSKRIRLQGTLLTPRSDQYKADLSGAFAADALSLFEKGELAPVVDKVFAMEDVPEAHRYMEDNKNTGKIVLQMD